MTDRLDPRPILSVALLCLAAGCAGPSKSKSNSTASLESQPGAVNAAPVATAAPAPAPAPALRSAQSVDESRSAFDHIVMGMFGVRMLDAEEWEPVEEPKTGGLNYMGRAGWLHWDFSVTFGDDSSNALIGEEVVKVSTKVWEIDLGVAKVFRWGVVNPYLGVGLAVVNIDAEVSLDGASASEDNTTVGGYGRAGIAFEVTKSGGIIGFEGRYLVGTDVDIGDVNTDVDGFTGLVTVGFSW